MNKEQINKKLDLAVLKANCTKKQVVEACLLAEENDIKSVCVLPSFVSLASAIFDNVSTVIGYPWGDSLVKYEEAVLAIRNGAKELDIVINHHGENEDIDIIISLCIKTKTTSKIILETCFYDKPQLIQLCRRFRYANFLKTSTGVFEGATVEGVKILLGNSNCRIKASGGIRTYSDAAKFIDLGCERIGSSGL